jgi:hypothetical protein
MPPRYDKLLIAAAGLLLAGSAAYAFLGLRSEPAQGPRIASQGVLPSGADYPVLTKEDTLPLRASWTRPEDNEDGWTYDLFDQVPTVWDEQLREYLPRDYTPPVIPDFGIRLAKLGHPRYPYMLRGSITPPPGRPDSDRILFLVNLDTNEDYNGRIGKPIPEAGLTPLSFKVVAATAPDGAPVKRSVLVVRDAKLGKDLEIDDQAPLLFRDRLDIVLQAENSPASWTFNAPGAKFEHNGATYVLKGVDLAAGTVTVDKTFTLNPRKGARTLTEVLSVTDSAPKPSSAPSPASAAPAAPASPTAPSPPTPQR